MHAARDHASPGPKAKPPNPEATRGPENSQPLVLNPIWHGLATRTTQQGSHVQAKLKVGARDDEYEREADRVADQVMRMSAPATDTPIIQRLCPECEEEMQRQPVEDEEEEEEFIQTRRTPGSTVAASPMDEAQITNLSGRGRPLPESVRSYFEPRFGQDFSQVRIHTGPQAAESARAASARAFTVGRDVVLGAGEYAPEKASGRRLLAHELTHTIQQRHRHLVQRQSGDDARPTTALEIYEAYQSDLPALGQELCQLISESANNVNLVQQVLDEVAWGSRDNVAYHFVQPVSEETLSDLASEASVRDLLGRLRKELAGGTPWPSEKKEIAKIDQALSAATSSSPELVLPSFDKDVPAFPFDLNPLSDLEGEVTKELYWNLEVAWSWLGTAPSTTWQLIASIKRTAETMQPLIECVYSRSNRGGVEALENLILELQYAIDHLTEKPASSYDDMRQSFEWIADALITLDPTLAGLEETGSVGSCVTVVLLPFAEGIVEAVTAINSDEVQKFSTNITNNPFFGPGFSLGAQAGILLDVRDIIFDILAAVMDPVAAANALRESMLGFAPLIDELSGATGADVAKEIGRNVGEQFIAKIRELNEANGQFVFAFELGKVVGPSIIYTILSLLGFEEFVAGRLLLFAEMGMKKLKNFSPLARLLKRSPDVDLPGTEKGLGSGSQRQGGTPEINVDAAERALLKRTGEISGKLDDADAAAELAIVLRSEKRPFSDPAYPDYNYEVDLGNGHRWRQSSQNGMWCRFSETPTNCIELDELMVAVRSDLEAYIREQIQNKQKNIVGQMVSILRGGKGNPEILKELYERLAERLGKPVLINDRNEIVGYCGEACRIALSRSEGRVALGSVDLKRVWEGVETDHTFAVAKVIDELGDEQYYLVDPTVLQFIDETEPWEPGESLIGTMMRGHESLPTQLPGDWSQIDSTINETALRIGFRDKLLEHGYVRLDNEVANVYVWALTGGKIKNADAQRLLDLSGLAVTP